jgi:hypothetical protein
MRQEFIPPKNQLLWLNAFFSRWGKPGDFAVDLFGGSGSTLIACEKTSATAE